MPRGWPLPSGLPTLLADSGQVLQLADRSGQRCGGPVLLAGLVLGTGVVELSSGPLGQTSRFSLELLVLLVLQLVGPMLVTLLAMALLLPRWLEPGQARWRVAMPAAALVGGLLLLLFLVAALTGGVLATPRADLIGEVRDLLSGVLINDLLRSTLRSALFLAILCGWSQWRGGLNIRRGLPPALISSNLLVEGLMLLLGLKLLWITALDPLRLSTSAQ
jgi:hypothetical protein